MDLQKLPFRLTAGGSCSCKVGEAFEKAKKELRDALESYQDVVDMTENHPGDACKGQFQGTQGSRKAWRASAGSGQAERGREGIAGEHDRRSVCTQNTFCLYIIIFPSLCTLLSSFLRLRQPLAMRRRPAGAAASLRR